VREDISGSSWVLGQVKPGAVHFSCSQPIMLSEEEKSSSGWPIWKFFYGQFWYRCIGE